MPNGFYGSGKEWERMETPLREIDALLARFAAERNMKVVENYHNWPQRQLNWTSNGINRSLTILLADENNMTFHVGVMAARDEKGDRYLKDHWLLKKASWDEVKETLPQLLEDGVTLLESWSERDLIPSAQFRAQQKLRKP